MPSVERIKISCGPPRRDGRIVAYPDYGEIKIAAVLEDGTEVDLGGVVEKIEWVAEPGHTPIARVTVIAPELDVEGWVEHLQLGPKEKVLRRIRMAEEREAAGLPRENFGRRFVVEQDGEIIFRTDDVRLAWDRAWCLLRGNDVFAVPKPPASIEGMNRLLEKRRKAKGAKDLVEPLSVRIQEWIEGEWVG